MTIPEFVNGGHVSSIFWPPWSGGSASIIKYLLGVSQPGFSQPYRRVTLFCFSPLEKDKACLLNAACRLGYII